MLSNREIRDDNGKNPDSVLGSAAVRSSPAAHNFNTSMDDTVRAREDIELAAGCDAPALIMAWTTARRARLAREIHRTSGRQTGPLVEVTLRAEAVIDLTGLLEAARTGTLFLDDLGQLDPAAQRGLLEVLDRPSRSRDARLVTGALPDLLKDVENGRFCETLFYRLNTVRIDAFRVTESPAVVAAIEQAS